MGKATFYIQFERKHRSWSTGPDAEGNEVPGGGHYDWTLRPVVMTANAPSVRRGTVLTKLTVEIPNKAFEPLVPEATIVFGLDEVESIKVTPEPPDEEKEPEPVLDA